MKHFTTKPNSANHLTVPIAIVAMMALLLAHSAAQAALVGLYQFEGNANDSSGNGNNGSFINGAGSTADTPLFIGSQSLNVTGSDQHVLVPHNASLNISSAMTIAAWVKPSGNGFHGILAKNPSNGSGTNHAGNYELRIDNNSRSLNFLYQRGGNNDTTGVNSGAANVVGNGWAHVAVSVDGTNATFYIDGSPVATQAMPAGFGATNTNPLFIGSRNDLFTDFVGRMDDVAIFDTALTQAEINTVKLGDFSAFGVGTSLEFESIPVFNTGVDNSNAVLAPGGGTTDPHWTITASPGGPFGSALVQSNHPAWLLNHDPGAIDGSSWISVVDAGGTNIAPGTYDFEQTFDMTGLDPDTALLVFEVAVDNSIAEILLNGDSTGITTGGFGAFNGPFTINSGFQDGLNTLTFRVVNAGTAVNPGGLRVNFLQAVAQQAVPEPTTAVLGLLGVFGLAVKRRRAS